MHSSHVHVSCRGCGAEYDQPLSEESRFSSAVHAAERPVRCGVCTSKRIVISPWWERMVLYGKLAAYAWPGGYPIIYVMADGEIMCPACANRENGSIARTSNGPDDPAHDGWLIQGAAVHWEGPPETCSHCGINIPSAYGDPEASK